MNNECCQLRLRHLAPTTAAEPEPGHQTNNNNKNEREQ